MNLRIGMGYDVHKLGKDRDLILGGIHIPYEVNSEKIGLLAHSDGDVLTHAIMDSLLGALALGDIGEHFPDTSDAYKDVSSMTLLNEVMALIKTQGYRIVNIDATLIAQAPKISPHKLVIRQHLAKAMGISLTQLNLKATTEEGLGFTGKKEGIAANSVCLLEKDN